MGAYILIDNKRITRCQLVRRSTRHNVCTVTEAGFYQVVGEDLCGEDSLCLENREPMWLQHGESVGKVAGGKSRESG